MNEVGSIQFVFCDTEANEFLTLGGAAFDDADRLCGEWGRLPGAGEDTPYIADFLDEEGSILKDKSVTASIIEEKLGEPLEQLIAKARANTER